MNKIKKLFLASILGIFLISGQAFAGDLSLIPKSEVGSCKGLYEAFNSQDLSEVGEFNFDMLGCYIVYLIDIFTKLSVIISFIFVLIGAFRYTIVYLEGDEENGQKAKTTIKNALIGLSISTLAYVIVDLFIRFLL
ncbi:hypothetical protein LR002_02350 [Candidatus Gracilibacteria bacterium]|nr:hypothetical protein [Candidatus Gracilibacteria bacterium]